MNKRSHITWTDFSGDYANFVLRGKAKGDCEVSPGCANCYAHVLRNWNSGAPDHTTFDEKKLEALSRWKPPAGPYRRGPGSKPMCFVVDMGDLFHQVVPDDFIFRALTVMTSRQDIDFQILTKRPQRMAELLHGMSLPENIWLGITTENQAMADARIPELLKLDAAVRFLSIEPQLEPVTPDLSGIAWVICGGESGANHRPFRKEWASKLYEQCQQAGVPFFFKQGADLYPGRDDLLNGQHIKQFPVNGEKQHG